MRFSSICFFVLVLYGFVKVVVYCFFYFCVSNEYKSYLNKFKQKAKLENNITVYVRFDLSMPVLSMKTRRITAGYTELNAVNRG